VRSSPILVGYTINMFEFEFPTETALATVALRTTMFAPLASKIPTRDDRQLNTVRSEGCFGLARNGNHQGKCIKRTEDKRPAGLVRRIILPKGERLLAFLQLIRDDLRSTKAVLSGDTDANTS
jgi:hypothetical protein